MVTLTPDQATVWTAFARRTVWKTFADRVPGGQDLLDRLAAVK